VSTRQSFATKTATVSFFDPAAGIGVLSSTEGEWRFHCTQLLDGARTIPEGQPVTFDVVAGPLGSWEAVRLRADQSDVSAFLCPVCGTVVVGEPGSYDICSACGWEDDPVQRDDTSVTGANAQSLSEARTALLRSQVESRTGEAAPEVRG
jgi:cold shock CspA family protein